MFNQIWQDCHPNVISSGEGSHWAVKSTTILHLCIARPHQMPILFLNIFTLLASIQSLGSLFHSFIAFCENEYFLISNLHCSLNNVVLCPLVLLLLCVSRKCFYQYLHNHSTLKEIILGLLLVSGSLVLSNVLH